LKSILKKAARVALHQMGGLTALRARHRHEFGILMFHCFHEADRPNMDALCGHIARYFEPVSMSMVAKAIEERKSLPDNAIAVTIDDGYRNVLWHGHPIFRKHRIPTTIYVVAGFSAGRLWLWPDQIEFGIRHTARISIRIDLDQNPIEYSLATPEERSAAISHLQQALIQVPNHHRLQFLARFGALCAVEIPPAPPPDRAALNWEQLRALTAEDVEIGCHTATHPILSRVGDSAELDREIRGAGEEIAERTGTAVRHFCYPNGRPIDIGDAAKQCVRNAGYASAVTCSWGFNTSEASPHEIRRIPFDSTIDPDYAAELLAGLHM
jgi:peptidoglycan/xylan/chitin deacetylase (PgdA/CDA1 family)